MAKNQGVIDAVISLRECETHPRNYNQHNEIQTCSLNDYLGRELLRAGAPGVLLLDRLG